MALMVTTTQCNCGKSGSNLHASCSQTVVNGLCNVGQNYLCQARFHYLRRKFTFVFAFGQLSGVPYLLLTSLASLKLGMGGSTDESKALGEMSELSRLDDIIKL